MCFSAKNIILVIVPKNNLMEKEGKMITIDINPKMKLNQSSANFNWVVRLASPTCIVDETMNNLLKGLGSALKTSMSNPERTTDVSPEDFEEIYAWFLS